MNRETTCAEGGARGALAREATSALDAMAERASRRLDRHAADYGLSDAKLEMLEVLGCCSGDRTCLYDLGERLGVTRPNITKLVDGLERSGLVERLPHPADRRMVQAHLTARGRELAGAALPGRAERIRALWDALDDDELAELVRLLTLALSRAPDAAATPAAG
ncbi:MAG: MarR family transcriptional regulator [Actinomycetota bacterium]